MGSASSIEAAGSGKLTYHECGRRTVNKNYGTAMHNIENTRRRSAFTNTIKSYIKAFIPYLKVYMTEVTSLYRRYIKWQDDERRAMIGWSCRCN